MLNTARRLCFYDGFESSTVVYNASLFHCKIAFILLTYLSLSLQFKRYRYRFMLVAVLNY